MTEEGNEWLRRDSARARAARDVERRKRRRQGERFWHALALVGSVGWPIVLLALGGAWLGRALDLRAGSGVRWTLVCLSLGTGLGTWIAFRTVRGKR